MEMEFIKSEKGDVEFKTNDVTLVEILRVYLNKEGVDFAAWRREHPDRPVVMKIQSKDVKKDVSNAVKAIKKDLDVVVKVVKK
jgi:DNA-directed RNA polymerase subunit L